MLKEIIEQKHYCFTQSFQSWEDAIRASYQPLLQDGIVEDIYVQAVIDCVKKYGPYIVIVPNIAMPHSTEGAKGCNGTAISFMKVEQEVDFDPEDPDKKARLFFSLAAVDHEQHMNNIQQLMDTLMNEEIVEALLSATSIEDLEKIAETYEA
ncbi:PTS sugar transporter subunit IIA [[Eubacterium] hominis]|uniref:PTS sugar transporter subunit IIA n=1 Tax=[Eubacterium] hominis TaxID=2764325 RepID=UPI003A4E060D